MAKVQLKALCYTILIVETANYFCLNLISAKRKSSGNKKQTCPSLKILI